MLICYLFMCFIFTEKIEGINDLWIIGDRFVSDTYREHFLTREDISTWYMRDEFQLAVFCKSRQSCKEKNLLCRLKQSVVDAINARMKLPSVMLLIIDTDVIESLLVDGKASDDSAGLYGNHLKWLAAKIEESIALRYKQLPSKAKKDISEEPVIYWTAIPNHARYEHEVRVQIAKFNNCLVSVAKVHERMRLIRLKEWSYDNKALVGSRSRYYLECDRCLCKIQLYKTQGILVTQQQDNQPQCGQQHH